MRLMLLFIVLLIAAGLALAQTPTALSLQNMTYVPMRAVADWLGGTLSSREDGILLAQGGTQLQLRLFSRAAMQQDQPYTMAGPAFSWQGVAYLPTRAVMETFNVLASSHGNTLTLSNLGMPPLVLPITPLPRAPLATIDTLAGLAPGDPLALAAVTWGDPVLVEASNIPSALRYRFAPALESGVEVVVDARGGEILRVATLLTKPANMTDPALLATTGTKGGLRLGMMTVPQAYQRALTTTSATAARFTRGGLQLLTYADSGPSSSSGIREIQLMRVGFPQVWLAPIHK